MLKNIFFDPCVFCVGKLQILDHNNDMRGCLKNILFFIWYPIVLLFIFATLKNVDSEKISLCICCNSMSIAYVFVGTDEDYVY